MSSLGLIPKVPVNEFDKCEFCSQAKITKAPHKSVTRESEPLDLIHSDICELNGKLTRNSNRYFITFIDDSSDYTYVYLIKNKSDVFDKFDGGGDGLDFGGGAGDGLDIGGGGGYGRGGGGDFGGGGGGGGDRGEQRGSGGGGGGRGGGGGGQSSFSGGGGGGQSSFSRGGGGGKSSFSGGGE